MVQLLTHSLRNSPRMIWSLIETSLIGTILVQFATPSLIVIGWSYRHMQRLTWLYLLKQAAIDEQTKERISTKVCFSKATEIPHWVFGARLTSNVQGVQHTFGSFFQNIRAGFYAVLTTWTLTLPAGALWSLSWWGGWNNSFHKGYEMATAGPTLGFLGVFIFATAMIYLPMAQARQAATGKLSSFYQGKLIVNLITEQPLRYFLLALLYAAFSGLITVFIFLPMFFPQLNPALDALSLDEARKFLKAYFFIFGIMGFWAYFLLKLAAARVYARAFHSLLSNGRIDKSALFPFEQELLSEMKLLTPSSPLCNKYRSFKSCLRFAGSGACICLVFSLWVGISFEIYVGEFLNYHPLRGFLNQPLVQLPWFRYLP